MKEIVVISGKGGTGKTSITGSFAWLGGKDLIVADCDVDAADMHLLLEPDRERSEPFYSGLLAAIDPDRCTNCGLCADVCRFDSIVAGPQTHEVIPLECEGCGYCPRVCPEDAIRMEDHYVGDWYISNIRTGTRMVHARLTIGAENSGKMVAQVKNEAKKLAEDLARDLVLVDGSPGIGCPVVSSLAGANFVVLVTEPTVSGLHDLKRVHELIHKFNIPSGCIINKADINTEMRNQIKGFLAEQKISLLAEIPYDESFTAAMTQGKTIVENQESPVAALLQDSWQKTMELIKG